MVHTVLLPGLSFPCVPNNHCFLIKSLNDGQAQLFFCKFVSISPIAFVYVCNVVILLFADLSECQLMHVPDAVYHLMRNTELKSCDLSSNVIKKIPPKFALKFSLITGNFNIQMIICVYIRISGINSNLLYEFQI